MKIKTILTAALLLAPLDFSIAASEPEKILAKNLCLVEVVDKSRSMADEGRYEKVKDALYQMLHALPDGVEFGITAFDAQPFVVIAPQKLEADREKLRQRIGMIFPKGQTNPLFGLEESLRRLRGKSCHKHLQLITDGAFEYPMDILVQDIRASETTVSFFYFEKNNSSIEKFAEMIGGRRYIVSEKDEVKSALLADLETLSKDKKLNLVLKGGDYPPAGPVKGTKPVPVATVGPTPTPDATRPVSFDLQDTKLPNLMRIISEVTNHEIKLEGLTQAEAETKKITIVIKDKPCNEAFDIILSKLGLKARYSGYTITISPK